MASFAEAFRCQPHQVMPPVTAVIAVTHSSEELYGVSASPARPEACESEHSRMEASVLVSSPLRFLTTLVQSSSAVMISGLPLWSLPRGRTKYHHTFIAARFREMRKSFYRLMVERS